MLTLIALISTFSISFAESFVVTPMYGAGEIQVVNKNGKVLESFRTGIPTFHANILEDKLIVAHVPKVDLTAELKGTTGQITVYDRKTKKQIFTYKNPDLHHDFHLKGNRLYALLWKKIENTRLYQDELIEVDIKTGKILRRRDILPLFPNALKSFKGKSGSLIHTNSITFSDWDPVNKVKKDILVLTSRNMSSVVLIDLKKLSLIKKYEENLNFPHDASVVPPDKIVVFDNGGFRDVNSRVVFLNAKTGKQIKELGPEKSDPLYLLKAAAFYAPFTSGAQRMANGNYLVTNGNTGRVMEISEKNEILWDVPAFASSMKDIFGKKSQQIFKVRAVGND